MRLTEELIELLTALDARERQGASASDKLKLSGWIEHPDELIAEGRHEGLIESADGASETLRLTERGRELLREISQRLISADQLRIGEQVRIAYLGARNESRFQKLSALGMSPGVPITVQQKFPSYVILCEETQIALEEEIARDIFVWRD
jgi:Fe2+ transport system protein FeoA